MSRAAPVPPALTRMTRRRTRAGLLLGLPDDLAECLWQRTDYLHRDRRAGPRHTLSSFWPLAFKKKMTLNNCLMNPMNKFIGMLVGTVLDL